MIVAIDVQYDGNSGRAGLVTFRRWSDGLPESTLTHVCCNCLPYEPGRFFLRELPVIMESIALVKTRIDVLVVDGYVDLDDTGTPGLGRRLFDTLQGKVQIVGVAKSRFRDSTHAVEILRGDSERPLFITAAGISSTVAANFVSSMHGPNRLPTLLKLADSLARGN